MDWVGGIESGNCVGPGVVGGFSHAYVGSVARFIPEFQIYLFDPNIVVYYDGKGDVLASNGSVRCEVI